MIDKRTTANLKGFAILVVMVGHLVNSNKTTLDYDLRYFAAFAVSIFLILSGYGLALSNSINGLNNFLKKRIYGVILPYLLATLLISACYGLLLTEPIRVIRTITLTNPNNPIDATMWFIYFIVLWYLLFFAIYSITRNALIRVFLLFAASAFICFYMPTDKLPQLSYQFLLHSFSFPIGVMLAEMKGRISFNYILVISFFSFLLSFYLLIDEYSMHRYFFSCISFGLLSVSLFSALKLNSMMLYFFGGISYEMYLFEGVLLGHQYAKSHITNAVLFILITLAVAYLFKMSINFLTSPNRNDV